MRFANLRYERFKTFGIKEKHRKFHFPLLLPILFFLHAFAGDLGTIAAGTVTCMLERCRLRPIDKL
jgi:hypothetical protein